MRRYRLLSVALATVIALALLAGCRTAPEPVEPTDQLVGEPVAAEDERPSPVQSPGIVGFRTATGTVLAGDQVVTLPTGGSPAGTIVPTSTRDDATLYLTRDGSVPSPANNWGGGFTALTPLTVTRLLEGVAVYRMVAQIDGEVSEPETITVSWKHEENVSLPVPRFLVDGRPVIGSVKLPVSDGSVSSGRLVVESEYSAATFYITRDGSIPSPDNYWQTQFADGTYIWSPEPTVGDYRVIAVWQGSKSPVAALRVEWE